MKLIIESKGTPETTTVKDENGDVLSMIKSITWKMDAENPFATIQIEFSGGESPIKLVGKNNDKDDI